MQNEGRSVHLVCLEQLSCKIDRLVALLHVQLGALVGCSGCIVLLSRLRSGDGFVSRLTCCESHLPTVITLLTVLAVQIPSHYCLARQQGIAHAYLPLVAPQVVISRYVTVSATQP